MEASISLATWHAAGTKNSDHDAGSIRTATVSLSIRFHLVDGTVESFALNDSAAASSLWEKVEPYHLFNQARLIVADEFSKTVYVPTQVNRLDFILAQNDRWNFPGGYSDILELTEAELRERAHLDEPALAERRDTKRSVGDLAVSFIDLRFAGGARVFMMVEGLVKLPTESHTFMNLLLSKRSIHMRLRGGGMSILNLANLVRYSVYPGVRELPEDAWLLSRTQSAEIGA